MYWHPAYVEALSRRVAAEAKWLSGSPLGKVFTYARQSWAAVGEESIGIPTGRGSAVAALRDGKNWRVPGGCAPRAACNPPPSYVGGNNSTSESPTDKAYLEAIGRAWLGSFDRAGSADISWGGVLLLRANAYDARFSNLTAAKMSGSGFGWFHTGAAMTETQCFNQTFRYAPFRRDCFSEHGVACFAESCGLDSFAGPSRTKKTPGLSLANFSRIQGAYWELLSNMNVGVHVSGLHSSAFLNPFMGQTNFAKVYAWADAYMGLHATPSLAPGGWVAFRPSEPEGQTPPTWIGDYSFLMRRLLGVPQDKSVGLEKCGTSWEPGNRSTPYGAWCRSLPPGAAIFLVLDKGLAEAFDSRAAAPTVRLVYSSATRATSRTHLEVRYDDGSAAGAVAIDTRTIPAGSTDSSWVDTESVARGMAFSRGGKNGADVWVINRASDAALLHMVEIYHPTPPHPVRMQSS